jgi:hypothetical protein
VTIRYPAAYVQRMRAHSVAVALLLVGITGCGSGGSKPDHGDGGPKKSAVSGDCFDTWNAPSNDANRAVVAGRFTVARVANWTAEASGGGPSNGTGAGQGCGYLFHTSDRYLSISGAWEGQGIRWGVPPTMHGSWSAEQEASGQDNADVDSDGRLSEK